MNVKLGLGVHPTQKLKEKNIFLTEPYFHWKNFPFVILDISEGVSFLCRGQRTSLVFLKGLGAMSDILGRGQGFPLIIRGGHEGFAYRCSKSSPK